MRWLIANPPALGMVVGDQGMGKTRLIEEVLSLPDLQGHRILLSRCVRGESRTGLEPVIDAMRGIGGLPPATSLSAASAALRPHLPRLRPSPPDGFAHARGECDEHLLLRGLLEVLAQLGPTVCVLEDLQWCGHRTGELLRALVGGLPDNLVLLTSHRGGSVSRSSPLRSVASGAGTSVSVEQVELGPLDIDGVCEMAAVLSAPTPVSHELGVALWERTGGVPGLVVQLLNLTAAQPDIPESGLRDARIRLEAAGVPVAVRDGALSLLQRLGEPARRSIRAAAVLGEPGDEAAITTISGLSPEAVPGALVEAIAAGALIEIERGRYGFRGTLAAEAVNQTLTFAERSLLHRRAARVLESTCPLPSERLTRHYLQAGLETRWALHAEAAAETAQAAGDATVAVRHLRDLLDQRRLPAARRAELAVILADVALRDRRQLPEVAGILRTLTADGSLRSSVRGEVRWVLGSVLLEAGDAAGWRDLLIGAEADLSSRPLRAAIVMSELAVPLVQPGDAADRRHRLERAAVVASRNQDRSLSLRVRLAGALEPLCAGRPEGRRAIGRIPWRARFPDLRRPLLWAAWNLGVACLHGGHHDQARAFLDDARRRAAELGRDAFVGLCEDASLELAWSAGQWSGLEERARAFVKSEGANCGWTMHAHLTIGRLLLVRGRVEEAERHLRAAAEIARCAGVIPAIALAAGWLARAGLARRLPLVAIQEAERGVDAAARQGIWPWAAPAMIPAVEAMIVSDRLSEARDLAGRFRVEVVARDAPLARAASRHCDGLVMEAEGSSANAGVAFHEAGRLFAALPHPYGAAASLERAGRNLMTGGDAGGADLLIEGLRLFEHLGAATDASRIRGALRRRSIGVRRASGRSRPGYGNTLSPREAQVVAVAVSGRTNAEVGTLLFISPRTAEHHLSSAMRKLGASSRRDLARRLPTPGVEMKLGGSPGTQVRLATSD